MPSLTEHVNPDASGFTDNESSDRNSGAGRSVTLLRRWRDASLVWLGPGRGITPAKMLVLFCVLLLMVFSRQPNDLLHPVFYAEDGRLWYSEAYNLHWTRALLIPNASYLQVLPRLFASVAQLVPLRWAPLLLNVSGAALQVLPAVVLLSARCSPWGPLPVRALLVAAYLLYPNGRELHVNITNAQWHLAMLQVLLAFGKPARNWWERAGDIVLFALGSVSGPFGALLWPLLLLCAYIRRQRWPLILAVCMLPGLLLQAHTIKYGYALESLRDQSAPPELSRVDKFPLGASPTLFVRIVGDSVVLDSMIGHSPIDKGPFIIPLVFFLLGAAVVGCGMRYGPLPLRLLALYTACLLAAALRSPMIADPVSRWHGLAIGGGGRYYFFPALVFLWSAIYTLSRVRLPAVRLLCLVPLCLLALSLLRWEYKPFPPRDFLGGVRQFEQAPQGEAVHIPINPWPWEMVLVKH